mmetsp:Transcript_11553/g.35722  ORF Transcript_11553/g.35722 Transcript_11553/m.35722 type:complete len:357 (+) Transcript_11553:27-1097(+)
MRAGAILPLTYTLLLLRGTESRLEAPTLLLYSNQSLSIRWRPEPGASAHASYRLLLTMSRPGTDDTHVTKLARPGLHELYWGSLPAQARSCFRVGAISTSAPDEERYSPETCVNSSGCDAPPVQSDSGSYAFVGAVLGAALIVFALAVSVRTGLVTLSFSPPLALPTGPRSRRGVGRSCYSHLTTDEASVELEQRGLRCNRPGGGLGATSGFESGVDRSMAKDLGGMLEKHPTIDATAFERRWAACSDRYSVFGAHLPSAVAACPTPDETEEALTIAGLVCIATGAVGTLHKSYFAGKVRGSGEWFMLELVIFWDDGRVQATFRADSTGLLPQLSDHFAHFLSQLFGSTLVGLSVE